MKKTCQVTNDPNLRAMYTNREKFAVETERKIAQQLGEPIRLRYSDVLKDTTTTSTLDSSRQYYQKMGNTMNQSLKDMPKTAMALFILKK